jgi:ABC-type antimicrobial peptide transport system permease subunit
VVLVLIGVAVGSASAILITRFIEKFLFNVTRTDPAMTAIAALVLTIVGLAAAWFPAVRASRVPPTIALRHD